MLDTAKSLIGFRLQAMDGGIGKVEEFRCDDKHWADRYLVADMGDWLSGRQISLPPHALTTVDRRGRAISVPLAARSGH
jgi:hypothetical protein